MESIPTYRRRIAVTCLNKGWTAFVFRGVHMVDKLAVFQGKHIRRIVYDGEWWFSVIDIVEVLVGSERPRRYWNDLKKKLLLEGYDQLSEKIGQLKLQSTDGKFYATDW